jgi:predicted regulator of Ras-like GTPase activity (Roadblock/LC7/MglB family)
MIKKWLSFALTCLLLIAVNSSLISAQAKTENDASSIAKIKAVVAERGTGENKRVEVKMLDGTKRKGYISQAGEDSFTLTDSETKQADLIAYRDVAKVKNRASKGDKIALGIVAGAGVVGAIVLGYFLVNIYNN